jgi:hypothetical protein
MAKSLPFGLSQAQYDKVLKSIGEKMARDAQAREDFMKSDVFQRIASQLANHPEPVQLDAEHLAYFPEQALAQAGLSEHSKEDVSTFLSAMSSLLETARENGSVVVEENANFDNATFESHGLVVSLVFGQGTAVTVSNKLRHDRLNSSPAP